MVRLFRVFIPVSTLILFISELLLVSASFLLGTYVGLGGELTPTAYLIDNHGFLGIALVVVSISMGLYLSDLYTDIPVKTITLLVQQLCVIMGAAFMIEGVVSYLFRDLRMPLHVMAPGSLFSVVSLFAWRLFFSHYVFQVVGSDRLLFVGYSPVLHEIMRHIESHPEQGCKVVGVVDDSADIESLPESPKFLGRVEELRSVVRATRPTRIVVGMSERRNRMPVSDLLDLRFAGHHIEEAPAAFEKLCGRVSLKELRPSQLIYSGEYSRHGHAMFYQTVWNLVVAGIGIVVSSPLMLLTAVAVRLSSPGPVLYRQKRVGMDGIPFELYKFRSMRADAEAATGAVWAARNDPRVTTVGRIIRKIRFDELPQFFNVLKGEMSIVGPRPERPEFVKMLAEAIPYYHQRHTVRPGITGWAQINYKYGDTLEDTITKLEYDLYYIKHMCFSLDIYIVFHTLKAMLLSRGAQ